MAKLKQYLSLLSVLGGALLLSGCQSVVFDPKGPIAREEMHLLITAVLLMLIVVVPVLILSVLIAYYYRASNKKAKYDPAFGHSVKLELVWWTVPIIIVGTLATITWITTHTLDPYRPLKSSVKPVTIQVVALEWRWLFIYPEQKIATLNFVEFPDNTPINFEITSDAPMNSFQIQKLAGQIYAMAGMTTKLHLSADEPGDYEGRSVSFSGEGFSGMSFTARATSDQDFNAWVAQVKHGSTILTQDTYNTLVPPSKDNSVRYFSSVTDGLFDAIVMKYMSPMHSTPVKAVEVAPTSIRKVYKTTRNYGPLTHVSHS